MPQIRQRLVRYLLVAAAAGTLALACGADPDSELSPDLSAVLTASEFLVGENRLPFTLVNIDGATIDGADVRVRFLALAGEESEFRFEAPAVFRQVEISTPHGHADGATHAHTDVRGFYTVDAARFDRPGFWMAEMLVRPATGDDLRVNAAFQVVDDSTTPSIGDRVPASHNLTARDVARLEEISTAPAPVPELYALTVEQALQSGRPFVVAFSTPAFCVSRMCGPVTEVLADVQGRFSTRADFLHIEPFDLVIARAEGRLVALPIVAEWGLETEPWVFVVDTDGRVAARFEGLLAAEELSRVLADMLEPSQTGPA